MTIYTGPQAPTRALLHCLAALLNDIQARFLLATADDTLLMLFDRLAAASVFLTDKNSARCCLALCQAWRAQQRKTGAGTDRVVLSTLSQCRHALQATGADDVLRQLLVDDLTAALDSVTVRSGNADAEHAWLRETRGRCAGIANAAHFLGKAAVQRPGSPPQTTRALLCWMLTLKTALTPDDTGAMVPWVFRRELNRCLDRCRRTALTPHGEPPPELKQELWQLQLLAGALLAIGSIQPDRHARQRLRRHCQGLMLAAAQAQHQAPGVGGADTDPIRELMRHALLLASDYEPSGADGTVASAKALPDVLRLSALPAAARTPMRELLAELAHDAGEPGDWPALSLRLYRLLVCLRLLCGGFTDRHISPGDRLDLVRWQVLIASLHTSADYCLQPSVVRREDQAGLRDSLRRLEGVLRAEAGPDTPGFMRMTLCLAARLGLRAQRHWQRLTLELDAVQQDFAGVSVQHVLAAELHYLPGMGGASSGASGLPQDVLRDLRLLLKGARILNVQRIGSLVLVMIELYQELLACPALAEAADVRKALPRAHRSLCRMLDQAAAWQAPGNARRMINSLYACLERWRSAGDGVKAQGQVGVRERPVMRDDDPWRLCLATNRRLRKLLQHQADLDSVRVLLLELLRSQEDLVRRQADYGVALEAPE